MPKALVIDCSQTFQPLLADVGRVVKLFNNDILNGHADNLIYFIKKASKKIEFDEIYLLDDVKNYLSDLMNCIDDICGEVKLPASTCRVVERLAKYELDMTK